MGGAENMEQRQKCVIIAVQVYRLKQNCLVIQMSFYCRTQCI